MSVYRVPKKYWRVYTYWVSTSGGVQDLVFIGFESGVLDSGLSVQRRVQSHKVVSICFSIPQ